MTSRLYYHDSYLTEFEARVTERDAAGVALYLDQTAFYPASGGQPHDLGTLGGIAVVNVEELEDGRIAHTLAAPCVDDTVRGAIDWTRRFDHMQQHTGQHLLSAVFEELHGARTVSFHLGGDASTIDLEGAALSAEQLRGVEARANQVVCENRPVNVTFEQHGEAAGLRKASEREGELRIVSIGGLDRSACGGTHVRATGEVGLILLRRLDKIRGNLRVEFLCGRRAVARARADYETLDRVARLFSAPLEEAPALVERLQQQAKDADKARRKLALELALRRGRELHAVTPPGAGGLRRHIERIAAPIDDELRALAQGFAAEPLSVFLAASTEPPSLLLVVSADSGLHAGNLLKAALAQCGGRGGGNAQVAQGSLPGREALQQALSLLG